MIKTQGNYSSVPANPVLVASSTGSDTTAQFNMIWGPAHTTVAPRMIEIVLAPNCNFGGLNIEANDTVAPWPEKTKVPKLTGNGDSFTSGNFVDYIAGDWMQQVATKLGLIERFVPMGTSGRGFVLPSNNVFASDLANIVAEAPDMHICALGVNDYLSSANTTTLQATAAANLQTLMDALPQKRFVVLTPWYCSAAYTTAILNAAAALSDQTRVRAINLQALGINVPGSTQVGNVCSDTVHPPQCGHDYLGMSLAPPIAAAFLDMAA